jgi:hypothetical protein
VNLSKTPQRSEPGSKPQYTIQIDRGAEKMLRQGHPNSCRQPAVGQVPIVAAPAPVTPTAAGAPVTVAPMIVVPVTGAVATGAPATGPSVHQQVTASTDGLPAAPMTVRLMLPLIMLDTAPPPGASVSLPDTATASNAATGVAATVVPFTAVTQPPAAAAILPATLVDAVSLPEATLGSAMEPSSSRLPQVTILVWVAVAALLLLPAGIATLGFLIWRLIKSH